MRNLRSSLLLILPLFAGCQILADLEYKDPVKKPSQRLQGEISREGDQWLLRPCQEQRRFVLSDGEGQDNLKDLASLAAGGKGSLYGDFKGHLDSSTQAGVDGQFSITRRYRVQGEGHGCDDPNYKRVRIQASGHEPEWSIAVTSKGLILSRPGQEDLALPYLEEDLLQGRRNFSSAANGQQLELWVAPQRCQDSMSGSVQHLSAELRLNGQVMRGCAYYGGAQSD